MIKITDQMIMLFFFDSLCMIPVAGYYRTNDELIVGVGTCWVLGFVVGMTIIFLLNI